MPIRSGNWDLRMAAIKQMAALFTAFDRHNYQKLIPRHLLDMLTIPEEVLSNLKQGGFSVSILGRPCHSLGIDEAHEMCINRECKEFVIKPSEKLDSSSLATNDSTELCHLFNRKTLSSE